MRLLLCGGGSGEKTILANAKFNEMIDHNKKLLYIPLAMDKERYPSCIEWLKNEMKNERWKLNEKGEPAVRSLALVSYKSNYFLTNIIELVMSFRKTS